MLMAGLGNPSMSLCIPVVALPRKSSPTVPHKQKVVFELSGFGFFLYNLKSVLPCRFPFVDVLAQPGPEIHEAQLDCQIWSMPPEQLRCF
jgi:hypothetical protein